MKFKQINKGDKFLCTQTVVMNQGDEITYIEGKEYISEQFGCITNELGMRDHGWSNMKEANWHFDILNPTI